MRAVVLAAFLSVGALLQHPARAQELADCARIADDGLRLSCYDRLAGVSPDHAPEFTGGWDMRIEDSPFTDDVNVYLSTGSLEAIDCGWDRDRRVVLWLRCREDTTSVMFQTGCHMTSADFHAFGDVTYRIDGEAARIVAMTKSRDSRSLGLWRGSDSIPFVRELFGAELLTVTMTPFDASTFTASFDVGGLEQAIAPLREACHW